MNLGDWLKNGWLVEHQPSTREIADLLAAVARDLADCQVPALSEDWRFNIAYNAALQTATAALAAEGYRAAREQHHFRIIQSLAFTIGADKDTVTCLTASGGSGILASMSAPGSCLSTRWSRCSNWRNCSKAR